MSLSIHKDGVKIKSVRGIHNGRLSGSLSGIRCGFLYIFALVFFASLSTQSFAADKLFSVSPERCVTLRAGQPCFARLYFEWKAIEPQKVCIQGLGNEPLTCFTALRTGNVTLPLNLPETTQFFLINEEGYVLGEAQVSVSWVYKKKSVRRRWRLF